MKECIIKMLELLKSQQMAKINYVTNLDHIDKDGKHSNQHKGSQKLKLEAEFIKTTDERRAAFDMAAQELGVLGAKKENAIDLSDQKLTNALSIIALAGKGLRDDTIEAITNSFWGNLAALKVLRCVYESQGMVSGLSTVDNMLFDPVRDIASLSAAAHCAFASGENLNSLATMVNAIARKNAINLAVEESQAVDFMDMIDDLPVVV